MEKILLITSEFPPLPGGIGNHAFLLAKYLQINDFDVSVMCDFRAKEKDLEFDKNQPFKIYRTERDLFTYFHRILRSFSLAKKNNLIVCSGKFSLWLGGFSNIFFPKKKTIAVLHGSEIKAGGKFTQFLTKWSLSKFDKLIAVSEFTKEVALSVNKNLDIQVINNGIELSEKFDKIEKPGVLNLVTVGNLTFRKGQQNVIQALPFLREKFGDIHYHCVGIPTEIEKFTALATSLQVLENITFYGVLSDVERNKVVQNSSIFLMLSQMINNNFEGFGIAILEANAMGIPAIGSKNSGIADAIKDGFSGILVHPEKPQEIQNAIAEIWKNYDTYSQNAKTWAADFDWKKVVKKYIAVFEN